MDELFVPPHLENFKGGELMAFDLVLPDMAYQAVHVIALLVGLYGAYWASNNKQGLWTVVFGLWAVTELIYLTVHLNLGIVTAGAAHVIQEALLLIAFLYVVYSAAMKK